MGRSQEAYERRLQTCADPREAKKMLDEGALLLLDTPERRRMAYRFLESACLLNDRRLAEYFIKRGADINCPDARTGAQRGALISAIDSVSRDLSYKRNDLKNRQIALLMIELGADPNWRPKSQFSTLEKAIIAGEPSIVRALLAAGADANQRSPNQDQTTPLMLAAQENDDEDLTILESLLKAGADPAALDAGGLDALDYAQDAQAPNALLLLKAWIERGELDRSALSRASAQTPARSERARL